MGNDQNYPVYLKVVRCTILAFLMCIVMIKCYLYFAEDRGIRLSSFLVPGLLLLVLFKRGWLSWWACMLGCPYAFYYLLFISVRFSEPSALEFSSSLTYLLFKNNSSFSWRHLISLFPLLCYLALPVIFLTPRVRKYYLKTNEALANN